MTDPRHASLLARLQAELSVLPDKPEETPESTLKALWLAAAGRPTPVQECGAAELPDLDAVGAAALDDLVARRLAGVPLAHLTGLQRFMGLDFVCGPAALIPRIETELLGEAALARLTAAGAGARCLDIGTGAGNLAVMLAVRCPDAHVAASDISADALGLARDNAARHGVADRVGFREGSVLDPFDDDEHHGAIDLVVCNPPYISSGKVPQMAAEISEHEPAAAFDGGFTGTSVLMKLIKDAPRFLKPGGWLAFEVGAGQGPGVARRVVASGEYEHVETLADAEGVDRVVLARR